MILIAKFVFVIMAVFGQERLFRETPQDTQAGSGLDTVNLTVDRPELVLAKRAVEDQGLCPAGPSPTVESARIDIAVPRDAEAIDSAEGLATLCP